RASCDRASCAERGQSLHVHQLRRSRLLRQPRPGPRQLRPQRGPVPFHLQRRSPTLQPGRKGGGAMNSRLRTAPCAALLALLLLLTLSAARGQKQFQGVCSRVRMVIEQEMTLERIGFEATLEVTDNDGSDPITDFFAELTFENPDLSTNGVVNDAASLF